MEDTTAQIVVIDSISLDHNQLDLGFEKTPNFSLNLDPDSQSPDHDLASTQQQQSILEEKLRTLDLEHEERKGKVDKGENIVETGIAIDELNVNDVVDYAENRVVEDNVKENSEILSIDPVVGEDDVKEEENVEFESKDVISDDVKESENKEHGLNDNREDSDGDADMKMQKRKDDGLVDDVKEIGDGNHGLSDFNEDFDVDLKKKEENGIKDKWGDDMPNLSGNVNEDGWGDYYMDKDGLEKSGDDSKINENYNGWNDNYIDDEVVRKSENHNYDGWGEFNNVDDGLSKSGNANNNEWGDYNNVDHGWKTGVNENIGAKSTLTVVDEESRGFLYPVRSDAEDCSFYLRTGTCKYELNCKFNHPLKKKHQNQNMKEKVTTAREEYSENPGMIECKYYLSSGGCKFGNACRYNHSRGNPTIAPVLDLNFVGLPIRPGEKECSYYLRTGSCKYAASCRFNHPDPTSGPDPSSGYVNSSSHSFKDVSHPTVSSRSLSRAVNETAPYVPLMFPPAQGIPSKNLEWNGVQTPTYPPVPHMRSSTTFATNNSATESNVYAHHQQHMLVEDFPERPGQPECSFFLKTGDCKYRSNCKFHHPKHRTLKLAPFAVTDNGLPLRPDQITCTHYSRYGICKFGPNCRFDHPTNIWNPVSSAGN